MHVEGAYLPSSRTNSQRLATVQHSTGWLSIVVVVVVAPQLYVSDNRFIVKPLPLKNGCNKTVAL